MTFQFKIQLSDISKPTVWRRVTVPSTFNFEQFHQVIQAAFGWFDYHLYSFSPNGWGSSPVITNDDESEDDCILAEKAKLSKYFTKEGDKFVYIYDFGDNWMHKIVLEKILPEKTKNADCLAGKGACPPEDCGGAWGYEEMKITLTDKTHADYEEIKEWLELSENEEFDPNEFDLEFAKEMVRDI